MGRCSSSQARFSKALKLFGTAGDIDITAEKRAPAFTQSVSLLEELIKAEVAERDVHSVSYRMKVARFPACCDLSGFAFARVPSMRHGTFTKTL